VFTNDRDYLKIPNLFRNDAMNKEKPVNESIFNKKKKKDLSYLEEHSGNLEERSKIGGKVKNQIVTTPKNRTNQSAFTNFQVETPS